MLQAYAYACKRDRWLINNHQVATARVGEVVAMAASMGEVARKEQTFLPFLPEPDDSDTPLIRPEVEATARELIRTRKVSLSIAAFLMSELEKTPGSPSPQ